MPDKIIDEWNNCYPSSWKGMIVESAFAHPAKFSSKLIRKIYDHILAEGWVRPGDTIVDPFGGVALGALDAMRLGLSWRGCELEERFVGFGNENIRFWNSRFSTLPKWSGDAVLLQGDSRMLSQVLRQRPAWMTEFGVEVGPNGYELGTDPHAHTAVSSPPYAETEITGQRNFKSAENPDGKSAKDVHRGRDKGYSAAVASPPFSDVLSLDKVSASDRRSLADDQGIANSAHVSPIDMEKIGKRTQQSYGGLVSSPPYVEAMNAGKGGIDWEKAGRPDRLATDAIGIQGANGREEKYGTQSAQLGAMKATEKGFQASVTSPPFQATTGGTNVTQTEGPLSDPALFKRHAAGNMNVGYGESDGNMGSLGQDDFWISARAIVEQVYMVLEPGAHAVWVVKDYVKNKERVPFCEQWQQMCEAVGFVTLHEHRAMLVRHKGISTTDMDGAVVSHEVSSKSFFRRIAEKKGSPPIDFETVYCMVKLK